MDLTKLFLLIVLLTATILAQSETDWQRWSSDEVSYEIPEVEQRKYIVDTSSAQLTVLSLMQNGYYFFISDLDGENCPFHPSCSKFFVDSVKKTDIVQGTLMFSDRFTRDLNLFGRDKYPNHITGKKYDPVHNYTLDEDSLEYIPPKQIATK